MKKYWALAVAALLVAALSIPASAATFKIGDADFSLAGSLRLNAAYQITDKGDSPVGTEDSETDFFIKNPGNSRFSILSKYDKVTGFLELGVRDESDTRSLLHTRHAYLSYDLGEGNSLLAGQTYSVLALQFAEQEMNGSRSLFGYGNLYSGRINMVRFTHKGEGATFNIEIENTDSVEQTGFVSNEYLPALAGNMIYKTGGMTLIPSFLVQQFELTSGTAGVDDISVLGYALALDTIYAIDKVTINAELWYGQNMALFCDAFDAVRASGFGSPVFDTAAGDIEDIASYGGWLQVTVPVSAVKLHVGGGYQQAETPDGSLEDDWSRYALFVSGTYNFTPQFFIQPEVAYFDKGEDANGVNEYGTDTFVGVHFRYNF